MDLYFDEFIKGVKETLDLHKQGESIFEMGGGNMFPSIERQQMWQWSKAPGHIHFSDGMKTYSFKHQGDLADEDVDLEKIPDVPLPDLFKDSTGKGKAQVHRADPGSIYFTLQEGTRNPTYTFKHTGGQRWKAIVKKKKPKAQLAQPAFIPNVNAEAIKEGMLKAAEELLKDAQGGVLDFFNRAAGGALDTAVNAPGVMLNAPGRIGDSNPGDDTLGQTLGNAGKAGLLGAGLGLGYHGIKQHFFNTPEENANENQSKTTMLRRMLLPGLALGGANAISRTTFPDHIFRAGQGKTPTLTAPGDAVQ
jgi:hypothetical protein